MSMPKESSRRSEIDVQVVTSSEKRTPSISTEPVPKSKSKSTSESPGLIDNQYRSQSSRNLHQKALLQHQNRNQPSELKKTPANGKQTEQTLKKSNRNIIIGVIILALIVGVIVLIVVLSGKKSTEIISAPSKMTNVTTKKFESKESLAIQKATGSAPSKMTDVTTKKPSMTAETTETFTLPTKPTYDGTIHDYPSFNLTEDYNKLFNSPKLDLVIMMKILCARSRNQRQEIRIEYKRQKKEDMVHLFLHQHKVLGALMMTIPEYFGNELFRISTKLDLLLKKRTLIEILVTLNASEILESKMFISTNYSLDLDKLITEIFSGQFKTFLLRLSAGKRDETWNPNRTLAITQAKKLKELGEAHWSESDVVFEEFLNIVVQVNPAQLQLVSDEYKKLVGRDLIKAIGGVFENELKEGLLAVVSFAKNPPAYFAEKLLHNLHNKANLVEDLIRIITSRSEIDLVQIKEEYEKLSSNLRDDIEASILDDHSKESLVAIVKGNKQ